MASSCHLLFTWHIQLRILSEVSFLGEIVILISQHSELRPVSHQQLFLTS